jgi:hypothetical protein
MGAPTEWPPPGFHSFYKITEDLSTGRCEYDMTLPSAMPSLDISTVRVHRHGGPSEADYAFRNELFRMVGAVTVAGGHVETAMKRLLLVDKSWTQLHDDLRSFCPDQPQNLADTLDWGEENRIKARRDNVVHAYWWIFDGCGVRRSRFRRKSEGAVMTGTMDDLRKDAELIFAYSERLDDLLGSDWAYAMLPAVESRQR